MTIAGAAFERAKRMLDDGKTTAHQLACTLHPRAMTFKNAFMLPATDRPVGPRSTRDTGP